MILEQRAGADERFRNHNGCADSWPRSDAPYPAARDLRVIGRLSVLLLLPLCLTPVSFGATPALDGFFPAGGARGSTNRVSAIAKSEVWPPKVWVEGEGLEFLAETNKGVFSVRIAADAAPGPRLVRLYNEEGSSDPHAFVIGSGHEIDEVEPNNHFAKPQRLESLPLTVNGRLEKNGDVDSFAIRLHAGEWLVARVDSYVLMSKVDALLRLVATNGQQLAWNHDFVTLDPRLSWQASGEGEVILQLFGFAFPPDSGIALTGGDGAVYRLHVAVTNREPAICEAPTEHEPNNTSTTAEPIELPAVVRGMIGIHGDEDRFRISLNKNESLDARVDAASFGSPLDAWLKIEDASGNQLAQSDDVDGGRDPRLEWKAGTNNSFTIAIGSVTHRGGRDYCYQLSIQRALPDFTATLGSGALELNPGRTNELKIDLKRLRGFTNELEAHLLGLPAEVTALTTNLGRKEGAVSIRFEVAAEAPKFQGPIRLLLIDTVTRSERAVPFGLTTRGETGFNHLLIESTDQFWLTVRPQAKTESKPKPEK